VPKHWDRESVRRGGRILADLAQNTNSEVTPRDIVAKHLSQSVGKVLSGRGRKRKRNTNIARTVRKTPTKTKKQKQKKKAQPVNKGDIIS
jgi:hypothetical protein